MDSTTKEEHVKEKGRLERGQWWNTMYALIELVGKVLVVLLTAVVCLQVISRFFRVSVTWTVELSRFLFAWLGFFGLIVAIVKGRVPRFTVFVDKLHGKNYYLFLLVTNLIVLVFLIALFISTFEVVKTAHLQNMAILPFKWSVVYISLPFCLLMMIIIFLGRMKVYLREFTKKEEH